jgi:hypothetical protein
MTSLSTHPTRGPLLQGLLPREHGVWFQLGLPLVALGLCVALPSPRKLHSIGWTLGVAGTLTLVLLGVGLS